MYRVLIVFALIWGICTVNTVQANMVIGQMAPAIYVLDIKGEIVSLKDLKGKNVILEWTNPECPFVKKHYDTHNMQATQKAALDKGAVWISINSSAKGKQGYMDAEEANAIIMEQNAYPSHVVLDPKGELGRLYGAMTTPHIFIIDVDGKLIYTGAIDNNPSLNPEHVKNAKNYVMATLDALSSGEAVTEAQTKPYGCGIKY